MNLFKWFKGSVQDKVPPRPLTGEKSWTWDSFFAGQLQTDSFDPDSLVAWKGFKVYDEMLRDDQVKAAFNMSIAVTISRRFEFQVQEDTPIQKELIEFFHHNLNNILKGTFLQSMRNILNSKKTGYSVNEMVFRIIDWKGSSRWGIGAIKLKPYETFRFKTDPFGNVIELVQFQGGVEKKLDPGKFIIHLTGADMNPLFGESDLRAAYRPYWEKKNILKFWDMYLEQIAGGFLAIKRPESGASTEGEADLQKIIKNRTSFTGMLVPAGTDIQIIHAPATDAFEKATDSRDRAIARALLIPNLLGLTPQQRLGALAQSKVHEELFFLTIMGEGDSIADILNECLFQPLALWNFGVTNPPRMAFDPFTDSQKSEIIQRYGEAVDRGIITHTEEDERRNRKLLGYGPGGGKKMEREKETKPDEDSEE